MGKIAKFKALVKGANRAVITNLLHQDLLDPDIGIERVKQLFRTYVQVVEIENHSYCNRTCWFCQNSYIDRRSKNLLMEQSLFEKILSELSSIDYDQVFLWSRYHEVLADESIYARMKQVRDTLPKAYLKVFSNGDYLNDVAIERLEAAGLNRMYISHYLPEGKEGDPDELERSLKAFVKRTDTSLQPLEGGDGYLVRGPKFYCTLHPKNFAVQYVSDRAGSLDIDHVRATGGFRRRATCLHPLRAVVMDYNGKCMLCCETRSDVSEHNNAIFGDLNDPQYTIFHFYRDLARPRANLIREGERSGVCATCDVAMIGTDLASRRNGIASFAARVPGLVPLFEKVQRAHISRRPV